MAKARKRRGRISFKPSPKVQQALDNMEKEGRKVRVVGQVRRGKVEMDPAELAEVTKKFPKSNIAFVALNAPFKTKALTGLL